MNKAYSRINFQNAPSTATPLNATNLNKMDKAINDLDDRIIELSGYQEEAQEAAEQASSSASAAAKAAETATADAEARVNAIIEGLEVYTKEESDKKFASVIKQVATGSPILIKDSSDAGVIDFKGKGRSTQNGTPTPDNPIEIKSVADSGWFDGELMQGYYDKNDILIAQSNTICGKNKIHCKANDNVKLIYEDVVNYLGIDVFDKNGNRIESKQLSSVNEISVIMPENTNYIRFYIIQSNVTPQTAKHITVTINNKYALIVKSVGKNLYNINGLKLASSGATSSVNGDTITVIGSYYIYQPIKVKPNTNYYVSGSLDSYTSYGRLVIYSSDFKTQLNAIVGNAIGKIGFAFNSSSYTDIVLVLYGGNATSGTSVYSNIQLEENTVATNYEPYKETVNYIPLNEPLRSSLDGTVTDEVSFTECKIKFKEVVFDGSDDEVISVFGSTYPHLFVIVLNGVKRTTSNIVCSHFPSYANAGSDYSKNMIYSLDNQIFINHINSNTVEEFKSWLQANLVTVIYELAEPITETIEPVDIVTYDNVTYLTASDNADMEVTYATDTKSYIDSKFAELHAALVNML